MKGLKAVVWPLAAAGGIVSATAFGLLAVLVVTDIVVRNLELARWPWLNELTEYLLTIATFFGVPWVLALNQHVNVDILVRVVGPRVTRWLGLAADLTGFAICALISWLAVSALLDARGTGAMVFKNIIFPEWYMMVPVLWCFAVSTLEFLARLLARLAPEARAA